MFYAFYPNIECKKITDGFITSIDYVQYQKYYTITTAYYKYKQILIGWLNMFFTSWHF